MRPILIWAGAAMLGLAVLVAGALLLPACALRLPFGLLLAGPCTADPQIVALDRLRVERAALLAEIAALEGRLDGLACPAPVAPDPQPSPQPEPDLPDLPALLPLPEPPPAPLPDVAPGEELSEDMLREGNVEALSGCWALESVFITHDVDTGRPTEFRDWTVCFDQSGQGSQTMRGSDGSVCEGPVSGGFPGDGTLSIIEPADLVCDNGMTIFRRETTCSVDPSGRAACLSVQPQSGGSGEVIMRRADPEEAP